MTFRITITAVAEAQLRALSVREQQILEAAIQVRLVHQPATPTRAIRQLRPKPFAEFELRVGDLRVLYNVEQAQVVLLLFGRKVGNRLIVGGEEFRGRQSNPTEQSGGKPGSDPD